MMSRATRVAKARCRRIATSTASCALFAAVTFLFTLVFVHDRALLTYIVLGAACVALLLEVTLACTGRHRGVVRACERLLEVVFPL